MILDQKMMGSTNTFLCYLGISQGCNSYNGHMVNYNQCRFLLNLIVLSNSVNADACIPLFSTK